MALNPPLNINHEPLPRLDSETFGLQRNGVDFEVNNIDYGSGMVYITNLRIIFVVHNRHYHGTHGVDIPLDRIQGEPEFVQPWFFGCNHLLAHVRTLNGGGLSDRPTTLPFRIYFKEGVGTFLRFFFTVLGATRVPRDQPVSSPNSQEEERPPVVDMAPIVRNAFIDPNDPSQIYVSHTPSAPPLD